MQALDKARPASAPLWARHVHAPRGVYRAACRAMGMDTQPRRSRYLAGTKTSATSAPASSCPLSRLTPKPDAVQVPFLKDPQPAPCAAHRTTFSLASHAGEVRLFGDLKTKIRKPGRFGNRRPRVRQPGRDQRDEARHLRTPLELWWQMTGCPSTSSQDFGGTAALCSTRHELPDAAGRAAATCPRAARRAGGACRSRITRGLLPAPALVPARLELPQARPGGSWGAATVARHRQRASGAGDQRNLRREASQWATRECAPHALSAALHRAPADPAHSRL